MPDCDDPVAPGPGLPPSNGGGNGGPAFDTESLVLCDVDADGNVVGTAIAVYVYDETTGVPIGAPTFVVPGTNDPYVVQGTLQECGGDCADPVQFCFTTSTTGPVDHPGRTYDIELPINQGFRVESLVMDNVTHAAGITWSIFDADGELFRQALTTFIQGRFTGLGATVTMTNPNAGTFICGRAEPMTIHIECVREDRNPPNLVELLFNAGFDQITNPAWVPGNLNGGYQFLSRQDNGGTLECTGTANRGWETNDINQLFEYWGGANSNQLAPDDRSTPTPRGTGIQEINAFGSGPLNGAFGSNPDTIWQTFVVTPADAGDLNIEVVFGGRWQTDDIRIRMFTGDPADPSAAFGDLVDETVSAPAVTTLGGRNPWTRFQRTITLAPGTYTLAFTGPNSGRGPNGANSVGGLFTDMRVFTDLPGTRATATQTTDQCVVTVDETVTVTDTQFWSPQCANGQIVSWRNAETGQLLTNTAFWAQVPAPEGCLPEAAGEDGGSTVANLMTSYPVCATIGGVQTSVQRILITDPSGGALFEQWISQDGEAIPAPTEFTIGSCTDSFYVGDQVLCDLGTNPPTPFLRKYVQTVDSVSGVGQVRGFRDFDLDGVAYTLVGDAGTCDPLPNLDVEELILCDENGAFRRRIVFNTDGSVASQNDFTIDGAPYVVGTIEPCLTVPADSELSEIVVCADGVTAIRRITTSNGAITSETFIGANGAAIVPAAWTPGPCPLAEVRDVEVQVLCDHGNLNSLGGAVTVGPKPFMRTFVFDADGALLSTRDTELDGAAVYAPVGPVFDCDLYDVETSRIEVCSAGRSLIMQRAQVYFEAQPIARSTQFIDPSDGLAVTPPPTSWEVGYCESADVTTWPRLVCATVFGVPQQAWMLEDGTFTGADGAAITPESWSPGSCDPPFIDREGVCYTLTSTGTEVHSGTKRHDDRLPAPGFVIFDADGNQVDTGTDGYEEVPCAVCCPQVIAEGCWSNGTTTGRWVSIRDVDGTVTLTDPVTGLDVAAADVVACPDSEAGEFLTHVETVTNAVRTLSSIGLWSWAVRLRSGVGSVNLGDGAQAMDVGETIQSEAGTNGTLNDVLVVTTTGGAGNSARLVWVERV